MDNLKIETVTERLFPEKFNEKLTPSQRFSAAKIFCRIKTKSFYAVTAHHK